MHFLCISDIGLDYDCSMGFGSQKPDGLSVAAMPNAKKAASLPVSAVRDTNTHLSPLWPLTIYDMLIVLFFPQSGQNYTICQYIYWACIQSACIIIG